MFVSFRQGVVKTSNNSNLSWLKKSDSSGQTIDLVVNDSPILLTFAHAEENYLIEVNKTKNFAWGSGAPNSGNAPLGQSGVNQYLYVDIDLHSAELTYGWTIIPPLNTSIEPVNPLRDTHWFDTSLMKMKVYKKNGASNGFWMDKIRLFVGTYSSSSLISQIPLGSQIGVSNGNFSAGKIVLGKHNKPLKNTDGTFVTSATSLITSGSDENINFDALLIYAQAIEEIPKFHCVNFLPNKKIGLASSDNIQIFVGGIVIENCNENDTTRIVTSGIIKSEGWTFDADKIGKPVFVGNAGQIRTSPPLVGYVQQVGTIIDTDSIVMEIKTPVRLR